MKLRIKEVAKRKGYTMKRLSEETEIDATTLSRYNTGKVIPPLPRLVHIANILECELIELLPVGGDFAHIVVDKEWLGVYKILHNK